VHLSPAPVVARVATTTAAARAGGAREWLAREVAVAAHLARRGAAVVAPASELPPGPHLEDGLAITFWRYASSDAKRPASPEEAGAALGVLHKALMGFAGELPPVASVLDEAERLIERTGLGDRLAHPLAAVRPAVEDTALAVRPLHGDAHRGNLLRTPSGLLWTDFEDTCAGPVEWDLACLIAVQDGAAEALAAYGAGVEEEALSPFVEARLLQVAAWTAFMAERHPQLRTRAAERLSRWTPRPSPRGAGRAPRPPG